MSKPLVTNASAFTKPLILLLIPNTSNAKESFRKEGYYYIIFKESLIVADESYMLECANMHFKHIAKSVKMGMQEFLSKWLEAVSIYRGMTNQKILKLLGVASVGTSLLIFNFAKARVALKLH